MLKRLLPICLLFLSGCVSRADIESWRRECPQFVQDNIGEVKYSPVSWGTLFLMSGVTDVRDGEIWLTAWADKHTFFHEAAHSVRFRTDSEQFVEEFKKTRGFVSVWSIGVEEEIAEAFAEGMKGRSNEKIDCAMRYFSGEVFVAKGK